MREANRDSADKGAPPTPTELAGLLGGSHEVFRALIERGAGVASQWRRYSARSPWVLKVSQGERTLFYVSPKAGAFEVTVLLGERATEAALGGRVSKKLHAAIRAARPYAEGRPVRVTVRGRAGLAGVEQLVAVKLDPGGGAATPSTAGRRRGSAAP